MLVALLLFAQAAAPQPADGAAPPIRARQASAEPELPIFSDPRLLDALGPIDPHLGAWAEYAVRQEKAAALRVRVAVVGSAPDGRYWLETVSQSADGPPVAIKLLVHGQPSRVRDVERALLYIGGQSPLELPVADAQRRETTPADAKAAPAISRRRPAVVRTPAGAFESEVVSVKGTRIFRSRQVPLWGLVQVRSADRQVDLIGYAHEGARTVFPAGWGDQGNGSESVK